MVSSLSFQLKITDYRKPIQTHLKSDARTSCKIKWVNTEPLDTHGKFHDTPFESSTYQRISLKYVFIISLFFHVMSSVWIRSKMISLAEIAVLIKISDVLGRN